MSRVIACGFTEGAEGAGADFEGNFYAVDYLRPGTVGRITREGKAEVFIELPQGSHGCGTCCGSDGMLYIADYTGHNILRLDLKTKELDCFMHEPEMTQPNDLVELSAGVFFASDPDWEKGTGRLWRCRRGSAEIADLRMGTANGVELSPDRNRLYVNETLQRRIWVYDVGSGGELSGKRLFAEFPDYGLDGMACDLEGNLYAVRFGKGTVAVLSPDGEMKDEILLLGKNCTNIAFGGADGRTVCVTLADTGTVECFRAAVPGRLWREKKR